MNTGIRRFILRLAVGLLAFLIGVTAAWALGGFNPFGDSSNARYYRHRHSDRQWNEMSDGDVVFPVYREHGCKSRGREFRKLPPPPPPPAPPAMR